VQAFIKVQKADVNQIPNLHKELSKLSSDLQESAQSYLYCPLPGKISMMVEKLQRSNIVFSMLSMSNLTPESEL
jgi:hypothetical protein